MTKPTVTPAMLKAARAVMQPGDRARFVLPNGMAFELLAGDGTAEPLPLPANQSESQAAHETLVANLKAALTTRKRQRA